MALGIILACVFIMAQVVTQGVITALPYPWGLISLITAIGCYIAYRVHPGYAALFLGLAAIVELASLRILGSLPFLIAAISIYVTATFIFAKRSLIAFVGIAAAGCLAQSIIAAVLEPSYSGMSQIVLRFILTFFVTVSMGIVLDAVLRRLGQSFMTKRQL